MYIMRRFDWVYSHKWYFWTKCRFIVALFKEMVDLFNADYTLFSKVFKFYLQVVGACNGTQQVNENRNYIKSHTKALTVNLPSTPCQFDMVYQCQLYFICLDNVKVNKIQLLLIHHSGLRNWKVNPTSNGQLMRKTHAVHSAMLGLRLSRRLLLFYYIFSFNNAIYMMLALA